MDIKKSIPKQVHKAETKKVSTRTAAEKNNSQNTERQKLKVSAEKEAQVKRDLHDVKKIEEQEKNQLASTLVSTAAKHYLHTFSSAVQIGLQLPIAKGIIRSALDTLEKALCSQLKYPPEEARFVVECLETDNMEALSHKIVDDVYEIVKKTPGINSVMEMKNDLMTGNLAGFLKKSKQLGLDSVSALKDPESQKKLLKFFSWIIEKLPGVNKVVPEKHRVKAGVGVFGLGGYVMYKLFFRPAKKIIMSVIGGVGALFLGSNMIKGFGGKGAGFNPMSFLQSAFMKKSPH